MAYILTNQSHSFNTQYHMKTISAMKNLILTLGLVIAGIFNLQAQTIEEAAELFNQAIPLISSGDNKAAIQKLEAVVAICAKLEGSEADSLKKQVVDALPRIYYNEAKALFDKNLLNESIEAYITTHNVAKLYNNTEIDKMTTDALSQLYLKSGNDQYKEKTYLPAIASLKKSLEYDGTNTSAMRLIAESYKMLDSVSEMIFWYRTTIEKADKNDKNAIKATERLMNYYMTSCAKLLNQKNPAEGIKYLDTAATFGENADLYYYYAVTYNSLQKYDQAITAAQKAISLEPNNVENIAKYNFELGTAWYGKKDNTKACEFYKLSNVGKTGLRADPMLKALKCK
jgi:tetratricopeptide (TPR) repeat protein